ncbi:unnamed protein product (macronuclear) [Paramecium tetraurelia]|uniref:Protein kinase domain-containing protein n=1 Tax=Paramecium tetraurelia TaxID=5888 RepID=A0D1V1_PARTE|nr:uncharacterized protein GSPATT00012543001 [Paramecium tetraurelia]CAK77018.1 unnamed protein product [Paramecium tetraurelia]|eukprot:XP_001444415.1 hypothetical protein (macronuclear) [Paramecium tetraurelia strain d4-2]
MSKHPIQNYQILKVIGKGAFAIVYQGQHLKTKEIVAIKQISTDMQEGPHKNKMLELFNQEIQIMKSIKHQNIVQLKEVQYTSDSINMILEYCALGDLEKYIKKNSAKNRLPENEAKPIILQLLDAMKILRLKNVVHRDLKLANILINEQMQIKLGDFGFAKSVTTDLLESYCGTPITMAPEILKKYDNYDHKCDIWSLGIMIYQILYGQPPFVSKKGTVTDLINEIEKQNINFPEQLGISSECVDLIRKMLVEDPKKRASFEDIFRHPWCLTEVIDLRKSILQTYVPQHQEFMVNLSFTVQQQISQLVSISRLIQSIENKYQEFAEYCVNFRSVLSNAFSSVQLNITYSNQKVCIKPENFKYFNYQQELLIFLANLYETAIQSKNNNILDFLDLGVQDYQISNYFSILYEEYTVTLLEEMKNLKLSQEKNKGKALTQIEDTRGLNKFVKSDLNTLIELIKDRFKNY